MARPRRFSEAKWREIVARAVTLGSARAAGAEYGVSEGSIRRWADIFGETLTGRPGRPPTGNLCSMCAGEKTLPTLTGDRERCSTCNGRGTV